MLAYAAVSTSSLVIPLYARELGADYRTVGLIGAALGLAAFGSDAFFGRLGDRADRRSILTVGFAVAAVAYALQFLARTPRELLFARAFVGFAAAMIPATLAAYVYDVRRPLGKFTSFNAMGWLIGSALVIAVGIVGQRSFEWAPMERLRQALGVAGPYHFLFLTSAAFCLLGFFVAWGLKPMRVRVRVPLFPLRLLASNAHVYAPLLFRHLGATTVWIIFPLYVVHIGGNLALVGWLHVVNMLTQVVVLRNADGLRRWGQSHILVLVGLVLSLLAFLSFPLVGNAFQLLPLQLLVGASFATLWLGSLKEVLETNVERATATGLLNATMSLSNVVGPLLGGVITAAVGFRATMFVGAGLTGLGLLVFAFTQHARVRRQRAMPAVSVGPAGEVGP